MASAQRRCWHIYPDPETMVERAAAAIVRAASQAIAERNEFHLVLAGGNTPRAVYEKLRGVGAEWRQWHIYFGDERCLPPQHPERNSKMAFDAWLSHVPIPAGQICPIPAELGPEDGARAYDKVIRSVAEFDMVLLGLGEDGHTASLFPGHDWGTDADAAAALPVRGAPKPPPERISLSAWRLSKSRQVLFLIAGASKAQAVRKWREGEPVPASSIKAAGGVDVLLEEAGFG